MQNLIILTGPTGIGKTEISLNIAKNLKTEIISADSMQIYKKMDIGTAKINLKKTQIIHHLIDIVNPDEEYNVSDFKNDSKKLISKINNENKIPLVVGGTGLYINSLVYNLTFQNVKRDDEYRNYLRKISDEKGSEFLYNKLLYTDKKSALGIDKNNIHRIIRALEICKNGDNKVTENFRKENRNYNLLYIGLNKDRELLYDQINKRVDEMIDVGLVDEVKSLKDEYDVNNLKSFKAIGYKEIIDYLNGSISLYDSIELIKKNSRHYAKRQLTWFRRDKRIIWLNKDDNDVEDKIFNLIGENFGI